MTIGSFAPLFCPLWCALYRAGGALSHWHSAGVLAGGVSLDR